MRIGKLFFNIILTAPCKAYRVKVWEREKRLFIHHDHVGEMVADISIKNAQFVSNSKTFYGIGLIRRLIANKWAFYAKGNCFQLVEATFKHSTIK